MSSTFLHNAVTPINEQLAINKQDEHTLICEPHLRQQCQLIEGCFHCPLPYQWQIFISQGDDQLSWVSIPIQQNIEVECAFCQPTTSDHAIQMTVGELPFHLRVSFESFKAECAVESRQFVTDVRRLSTCSYAVDKETVAKHGKETDRFVTQWRWYYFGDGVWQPFGRRTRVPQQYVLESKYLSGQAVYRFETESDGDFIISLWHSKQMTSLKTGNQWKVLRRPQPWLPFMTRPLDSPVINTSPFDVPFPSNWSPIDADQDYELVPLDPVSMEYHLVASAFHESISLTEKRITDIFRIQNVFLWHKYYCKQKQMQVRQERQSSTKQHKQPPQLERQLFHGTRSEMAVQAIFRQNFDWRLNGKSNDVVYGQGAYFALNAGFSDRYARDSSNSRLNWMFLARVLVGQSAVGNRAYVRPPPIDPMRPHGDLYDSCVNDLLKPVIFVIFDSDQCYPEYVISYVSAQSV